MLQRLYIHNFRCLENFELKTSAISSALLIGRNGSGKSTIKLALEIFQRIGRGINRVGALVQSKDFARGRSDVPMRFEIEVTLEDKPYQYILALEFPPNFQELRVLEEQMIVSGRSLYSRRGANVTLQNNAHFFLDWHLIALPVIQVQSEADPLHIFKTWLSRTIILSPFPSVMSGNSSKATLEPNRDGSNLGEWLSGLLGRYPAAYAEVDNYLRAVMPDIVEIRNDPTGKDARRMNVYFAEKTAKLIVNFDDLSDGEKCMFLCAVVVAANKAYGPLLCFWDEPDNYLSLSEVGHFIQSLRRSFRNAGQIIVTSHNEEAIRKFSDENTWLLDRKSHLEPTLIKLLEELPATGDLITALITGDIKL